MRRLSPGARLVLATHNPGKVRELAAMLRPHGVEVRAPGALAMGDPGVDAPDFVGTARLKALAAARASGLPALADDSGFSVAALGGAPGVLSARWAGPGKDFAAAMERVHREMAGSADRRAWFTCALSLAWPDGATATFLGRAEGTVAWPPRGDRGFGYDPMFVGLGTTETYGEMDSARKHATSHRARAVAQLLLSCFEPARLPEPPRKE